MKMKSLRIMLRQTMAIALLTLPMESFGEDRRIALAFDDGPHSGASEDLLDELHKLKIKATFFSADEKVKKLPERSKAKTVAGQQPGNHRHSDLIELAPRQAAQQVASATRILRELSQKDQLVFHHSSEYLSVPREQNRVLEQSGMPIPRGDLLPQASADTQDPEAVANFLANNAFPGAVILMQSKYGQRQRVVEALPLISERLRAQGYEFASLSDLLPEQV